MSTKSEFHHAPATAIIQKPICNSYKCFRFTRFQNPRYIFSLKVRLQLSSAKWQTIYCGLGVLRLIIQPQEKKVPTPPPTPLTLTRVSYKSHDNYKRKLAKQNKVDCWCQVSTHWEVLACFEAERYGFKVVSSLWNETQRCYLGPCQVSRRHGSLPHNAPDNVEEKQQTSFKFHGW